ncbi:MAG: LON peptidase substrate-binding domain-containing protein [Chloroflexi bacterium]|nr:LON peptidase substrate-binding domain-containing protein [Chloroflexota bacterium]
MIQFCLDDKRPFGVVLIRSGVAEGGPVADPYEVGCVAEIVEVERLEDGRLLLMTVGTERFRILSLNHDRAYLMGTMEDFPFAAETEQALAQAANRLLPLVAEYLRILADTGHVEFDSDQMPTDPEDLIFLAAAAIQVDAEQNRRFWKRQSHQRTQRTDKNLPARAEIHASDAQRRPGHFLAQLA